MAAVMTNVNWVDWLFIGILVLSLVTGLVRGLVFEVMSLLGWVVAYVAAQWFSASLAPHLPVGTSGSALNHAAAFAATFIAALIVYSLLTRLVRMFIHATPLKVMDRVLGATFGLARALVVLLAITTVVMLSSLAKSQAWQASRGAVWLNAAVKDIKPLLPSRIAEHLPR